jgi:hypothetical protein
MTGGVAAAIRDGDAGYRARPGEPEQRAALTRSQRAGQDDPSRWNTRSPSTNVWSTVARAISSGG